MGKHKTIYNLFNGPVEKKLSRHPFKVESPERYQTGLQKQFSRIFTIMYKKGRVTCYLITLHRPSSYRILIAQDVEYLRYYTRKWA